MTNALSRVPSGGGTNRTLCNIEETDDIVRQLNSDDTVRHLNSDDTVRQLTSNDTIQQLNSDDTVRQLNSDDTIPQPSSGNLESLAASVKEDFSRLNRNGGLDLVPAAQVDFFIGQDFFYRTDFFIG